MVVAGPFTTGSLARHSQLPMSTHSATETTLPPYAIHKTMGAAIGAAVALLAIATALIVAAISPTLDRYFISVVTGLVIGAIGVAVTVAAFIYRVRLPDNNDAWILW